MEPWERVAPSVGESHITGREGCGSGVGGEEVRSLPAFAHSLCDVLPVLNKKAKPSWGKRQL